MPRTGYTISMVAALLAAVSGCGQTPGSLAEPEFVADPCGSISDEYLSGLIGAHDGGMAFSGSGLGDGGPANGGAATASACQWSNDGGPAAILEIGEGGSAPGGALPPDVEVSGQGFHPTRVDDTMRGNPAVGQVQFVVGDRLGRIQVVTERGRVDFTDAVALAKYVRGDRP